jgi:hypothetical protein
MFEKLGLSVLGIFLIGALIYGYLFGFDGVLNSKQSEKQEVVTVDKTALDYYRQSPNETRQAYRKAVRLCSKEYGDAKGPRHSRKSKKMPKRIERMLADYFMVEVRLAVRFKAKTINNSEVRIRKEPERKKILLNAILDGRKYRELSALERRKYRLFDDTVSARRLGGVACIEQQVVAIMSGQ